MKHKKENLDEELAKAEIESYDDSFKWNLIWLFLLAFVVAMAYLGSDKKNKKKNNKPLEHEQVTRDYGYEAYCVSIWDKDQQLYLDSLMGTKEYQEYIYNHGVWWD